MQYELIKPYIEKKLVSENPHPEDPDVRIFNYTQACQFSQSWDDVTRQCRGLIMNVKTGEVLARPFPKFFNYGEHVSKGWAIPTTRPEVYEKLDGSLGILYWLNGRPWIATRGSFTSEQAIWATEYFRTYTDRTGLEQGNTHLFEIIYPANRIVVAYDFSDLVYLTSIETATGKSTRVDYPFRKARKFDIDDVTNLLKLDEPNSEGFVVFYPEENVRMKVKFPEYVRLHKLVTGVNEIAIWEHLRDGKNLNDLLEKVPDEFFQWVTETTKKLRIAYEAIDTQAHEDYWTTVGGDDPYIVGARASWRKDFAIKAQKCKYPQIMFAKLDEKPVAPIIWRMVRPHGARVFKTDIDL
jgi:RNA ligase